MQTNNNTHEDPERALTPKAEAQLAELLVDYHLGQLDPQTAGQVQKALADSAQLAARSEAVARLLARLDAWEVPAPPTDLAGRVLQRVQETERTVRMPTPARALFEQAGVGAGASGGLSFSIRELVALAACIVLFVGVFTPAFQRARSLAHRQLCGNNLRAVMTGMTAYAQTFRGQLPFAGARQGAFVRTPGVARVSNSRHPYVLVRLRFVQPQKFICPARKDAIVMVADDPAQFDDFPEPANISYDTQNLNGPRPRIDEHPEMAIIADRNPLLDGGYVHRLGPYEQLNSRTHENGSGQNVGYCSGVVAFTRTPACGVCGDDIWRPARVKRLTGLDVPRYPTDSFLIP